MVECWLKDLHTERLLHTVWDFLRSRREAFFKALLDSQLAREIEKIYGDNVVLTRTRKPD